ncbi:hypothetical protein DJ66_0405 [Candidatus Liberibacter solanacearum]|uniref:Restriction endonuclease n=2 Tax=Candidatus Liberibacter solanacearum TaxID=556287 RepID=A0A0F4VJL4_9HYPH|nr:hypothetical protein DJ66_0405 [Candidatus Liberibacter solanacearum]
MIDLILQHLNKLNLDVRITKDARFTDQKCTPDVVCIIADCAMNIRSGNPDESFVVKDIWDSLYFKKHVQAIFNKPSVQNPTTKSEYDKFIQQPLRLLAYASVLDITKGKTNVYTISNLDLLEFISLKDRNSYLFLYHYFSKVLSDSGMLKYFEEYRVKYEDGNLQERDFNTLKNRFQKFIIGNTNVNGKTEVNRLFPKLLNIYATENSIPGSQKGRMSAHPFQYSDLMYNRTNWRDVNKNKKVSRQEVLLESIQPTHENANLDKYLIQKAITIIKHCHSESEVKDQWHNGDATQVHHIFPSKQFPLIAHYVENLIRLTPTQHYTKAHPNNKTNAISKDYQLVCLLSKS